MATNGYQGYRPPQRGTFQGTRGRGNTASRATSPQPNNAAVANDPRQSGYYANGQWFDSPEQAGGFLRNVNDAGLDPGMVRSWGDQGPLYANQFASDKRATGEAQANTDKAVGGLQSAYDQYLSRYSGAKADEVATRQQAIQQYIGSGAQKALDTYADPKYQAVSDEFVGQQRALASRGIAKEQANATAAGVALAGRHGYQGSGVTPALTAAAGYRGAGDRAATNAQLATDQLTYNTDFRKWATGESSARDAEAARLRGELGTAQGQTAPANPYAGQMATLQNERPVYMPDFTQVPTQQERDRVLQTLGMSADEAQASVDSTLAYLRDAQTRAASAEERNQITEMINIAVSLGTWLGKAVLLGG